MSGSGEYIFRKALLRMVGHRPTTPTTDREDRLISAFISTIETFPAADVRPVVRVRWIDHQEGRWIYAKCSECGTVHDVKSNFCPSCGAWMEES